MPEPDIDRDEGNPNTCEVRMLYTRQFWPHFDR